MQSDLRNPRCASALLLYGVQCVVQSGAMVGAGSLVPQNKVLEGGYMWLGSPVKRARELTDKEKSFLLYSAKQYVKLKNRHSE